MASGRHSGSPEGTGRFPARTTALGGEPADRCALGGGLYVAMTALGAATLFFACGDPPWRWVAAVSFCAYAPAAGLLFALRGCGHRAGRRGSGPAVDEDGVQARRFWLHLPLVLPAWLLPPAAAGIAIWLRFSWLVVALGALFALESMVVLPLVARFYIGPHCPQKNACPWMRGTA